MQTREPAEEQEAGSSARAGRSLRGFICGCALAYAQRGESYSVHTERYPRPSQAATLSSAAIRSPCPLIPLWKCAVGVHDGPLENGALVRIGVTGGAGRSLMGSWTSTP